MAACVSCVYTSCGCNRVPHCVDWGRNNLVCYGACNSVIVFKPESPAEVICTLVGHTGRVNSVQWIRRHDHEAETEILSCSTDKTARLWRRSPAGDFACVGLLAGHTDSVTRGAALGLPPHPDPGPRTLIATTSVDSSVKIWQRVSEEVVCTQTVSFGGGFMLDVAWIMLPGTSVPLLAAGGDDQKVYLMVQQGKELLPVLKLTGHEDWIRCLDMIVDDAGDVLLATSSQDQFIRIWRVSARDLGASSDEVKDADLRVRENTFTFTNQDKVVCYAVSLESVLQGHDHWVYGVHWQPAARQGGTAVRQPLCLLSVSMDKTMIVWVLDSESGMWVEQVRVGAVGGNTLGLYGGVFSPAGDSILAHGYQGAFHMWNKETAVAWSPGVTVGGHFAGVEDVAWEPVDGHYLVSASLDQTTRLHGYWVAQNPEQAAWHELARPQVHGYDLTTLAPLDAVTMATGADEKVTRVFQAPTDFVNSFKRLCQVDLASHAPDKMELRPSGASVPALGLSNKAVFDPAVLPSLYEGDKLKAQNDLYSEVYFSPLSGTEPPKEENLLQDTLWPEVQKLYGHGYEVFALAAHPDGTLLASACKASKAEHAAVLLWERATWRQVAQLKTHALTVTQLAFSHSGRHLLSVSRDRTWALYERRGADQPEADPLYHRVAFSDKKTSGHARIIWACAWSHDDRFFVTVSRDKKAIVWGWSESQTGADSLGSIRQCSTPLEMPDSVTAVDFAPDLVKDDTYLLAFGLDAGNILLYRWSAVHPSGATSWIKCAQLARGEAHHLTVRRLRFRPRFGCPGLGDTRPGASLLLASCGLDNAVKIHKVDLTKL